MGKIVGPASADPKAPPAKAELILITAAALFREKGYVRATTRELGEAVGIRGPSVYYHYKTKDDILYGICVESLRRLTERVEATSAIENPLDRLRALIKIHVVNILEDRDMHTTMLTELRFLTPERQQDVTQQRDAYEAIIEYAIAEAQRAGDVRIDIPSRQLTLALLNLLNWTIFWFRPDGALSAHGVADLLATVFLDGLLPRPQAAPSS